MDKYNFDLEDSEPAAKQGVAYQFKMKDENKESTTERDNLYKMTAPEDEEMEEDYIQNEDEDEYEYEDEYEEEDDGDLEEEDDSDIVTLTLDDGSLNTEDEEMMAVVFFSSVLLEYRAIRLTAASLSYDIKKKMLDVLRDYKSQGNWEMIVESVNKFDYDAVKGYFSQYNDINVMSKVSEYCLIINSIYQDLNSIDFIINDLASQVKDHQFIDHTSQRDVLLLLLKVKNEVNSLYEIISYKADEINRGNIQGVLMNINVGFVVQVIKCERGIKFIENFLPVMLSFIEGDERTKSYLNRLLTKKQFGEYMSIMYKYIKNDHKSALTIVDYIYNYLQSNLELFIMNRKYLKDFMKANEVSYDNPELLMQVQVMRERLYSNEFIMDNLEDDLIDIVKNYVDTSKVVDILGLQNFLDHDNFRFFLGYEFKRIKSIAERRITKCMFAIGELLKASDLEQENLKNILDVLGKADINNLEDFITELSSLGDDVNNLYNLNIKAIDAFIKSVHQLDKIFYICKDSSEILLDNAIEFRSTDYNSILAMYFEINKTVHQIQMFETEDYFQKNDVNDNNQVFLRSTLANINEFKLLFNFIKAGEAEALDNVMKKSGYEESDILDNIVSWYMQSQATNEEITPESDTRISAEN